MSWAPFRLRLSVAYEKPCTGSGLSGWRGTIMAVLVEGRMDLAAFAAAPHALVSIRNDVKGAVDEAPAVVGLQRRVAFVAPYMLLLPRALEGTDLVASVPEKAARLTTGALTQFEPPVRVAPWSVEMLWNPAARTNLAA